MVQLIAKRLMLFVFIFKLVVHERLIQKGCHLVLSVATRLSAIEIGMASTPRNWGGAAQKAACVISWMQKLKG
ncbi:hypothetical protein ADN01_02045 [Levilinea saccharolytica]|uniref:Uncharacterized protein n=1 Tax=Levilinea saccharolytica TaxID=229921 RepID=A0A0N8GT18_9CHLR|nr:hypothetical protein ADN01_02045 [Levilinea saccharolytica]